MIPLSEEIMKMSTFSRYSGNPQIHGPHYEWKWLVKPILCSLLVLDSLALAEVIRFEADKLGTLPRGWSVAMTHDGSAPRWEIVQDKSAPSPPYVLAQLSRDRTAGRFPLAIWDRVAILNGSVSVAFKTVDGAVDQAAGIVWRYQDPNNYYIVRATALESNVVLYKVENGVRASIAPPKDSRRALMA
jgi:hypothetical protein